MLLITALILISIISSTPIYSAAAEAPASSLIDTGLICTEEPVFKIFEIPVFASCLARPKQNLLISNETFEGWSSEERTFSFICRRLSIMTYRKSAKVLLESMVGWKVLYDCSFGLTEGEFIRLVILLRELDETLNSCYEIVDSGDSARAQELIDAARRRDLLRSNVDEVFDRPRIRAENADKE